MIFSVQPLIFLPNFLDGPYFRLGLIDVAVVCLQCGVNMMMIIIGDIDIRCGLPLREKDGNQVIKRGRVNQ